ncbi:hypothetical protein [Roseateles violae]|uniref:GGDEF domain-containing protein n=1 Tax=Roseateles violae TaxID=3058042 RepID=A0ABT8DRT0_9BURK|nr:hypothetical protein [Pelomonas sp. PFR6]MDN3921042.1 hypothetical protein [Pelomonas sp. PFR6]
MSETRPKQSIGGKLALAQAAGAPAGLLVATWAASAIAVLALAGWGALLLRGWKPGTGPAWLALAASAALILLAPFGALRRQQLEAEARRRHCFDADSKAASAAFFEAACEKLQTQRQPFGLMVIELSGAMEPGFALASPAQLAALQWAAGVAIAGTRGSDLVGRLPGLRLAVLLADISNREQLAVVVNRLSERLDPQRQHAGLRVFIGAAVATPGEALPPLLDRALRPWKGASNVTAIGDNASHVCPV